MPDYPPLVRGRQHSDQTRDKLRQRRLAYLETEQGQQHMAGVWERKRDVPRPEQTRQKISATKTATPRTEAKEAAAARRRGQPPTPAAAAANTARRGRADTIEPGATPPSCR